MEKKKVTTPQALSWMTFEELLDVMLNTPLYKVRVMAKKENEMSEKTIFVRRGQILTVECLRNGVTGEGFFIVKNEDGEAVQASEIRTTEGVVFTADESKRIIPQDGIEYDIYLSLKQHLEDGSQWGIERIQNKDYGDVQFMYAKDIAKLVNDDHNLRIGIGANAIGKVCRSLGMRSIRTGRGVAIVLEEQDMQVAYARFNSGK